MDFGPVPSGTAAGAILAHSMHAGGKRLKKGRILSSEDCDTLVAAGIAQVTVVALPMATFMKTKRPTVWPPPPPALA